MFGLQTTVNDRMKNNGGHIAGPDHALMGQSVAPLAPGGGDVAAGEAAGAPNYRECDDAAKCCKVCEHNDASAGMCMKYNFKNSPMMTCDSFESPDGKDDESLEDSGMSGGGDTGY